MYMDAWEKVMHCDLRAKVCRSYCDEDRGLNAGMGTCFSVIFEITWDDMSINIHIHVSVYNYTI